MKSSCLTEVERYAHSFQTLAELQRYVKLVDLIGPLTLAAYSLVVKSDREKKLTLLITANSNKT